MSLINLNKQHIAPQILLRAWPFPRGAGRIVDRLLSNTKFTDSVCEVKTTDGFAMSVMPNDLIGRHIYLIGEFDRTNVEVILKHAKPGDTLLDIGANIGYVSACFLANVGASRVIAVEPQSLVVDLLSKNLSQFGARARVAPVAISDEDRAGFMSIDEANRGGNRLVSGEDGKTQRVEVWSASHLVDAFSLDKIDLVKIDVEGHEETVFKALSPVIDKFKPRMILFETTGDAAAPDGAIGQILKTSKYNVFGIKKGLTRVQFPPILSSADCKFNDYVALPDNH